MSELMKALVKAKSEPGLWMQEVPVPVPNDDEVLIKIKKTAICGTDMHIYNWDEWAQSKIPVPMVVGHEYAGEIVAMGDHVQSVRELKIGQRVSGEGHIVGHTSRNARAGRFHLDPDTKGVGVDVPGAFAEYLKIPAFNVVKLPDDISDDIAAILDPLGNAVHTTLAYNLVGEDVLITGAGPIGIMAAAVARHVGARHIVLTDVNDFRLQLAKEVTDANTVNVAREDLRAAMEGLGMTEGFDIGLEMSGSPDAFDQMAEAMMMGGHIALLGLPNGKPPVDWSKLVLKALTLKGIYGREMFDTWYKMFAMLQSGLDVSGIITHHFPVDDFEEGFKVMNDGTAGKVILDWSA